MLAVYGLLVMAVTVILFTYAVLAFRRPNPPRWTTVPTMEATVTIAFTGAVAFGFGFLVKAFLSLKTQPLGVMEYALMAATLAGFVVMWRFMSPGKKLKEYDEIARGKERTARGLGMGAAASGANDGGPESPSPRSPVKSGGKSRAA